MRFLFYYFMLFSFFGALAQALFRLWIYIAVDWVLQ